MGYEPNAPYVSASSLWINPSDAAYGAVGDGTTDDTTAVQAALNAVPVGGTLFIPGGKNYKTGVLSVPNAVRRVTGTGTLTQKTAGVNLLGVAAGATSLLVDGITFAGISSSTNLSQTVDNAISATGSSGITVTGCTFTGWQSACLYAANCTDIAFTNNKASGTNRGVLFTGVRRFSVSGNQFRDPTLQTSTFTICIGIDSLGASGYAGSADGVISQNVVKSYVYAQAVLVHDGQRISIVGNTFDDVHIGVGLVRVATVDTVSDITVSGNTINCTSTAGPTTTGDGIGVSGGGATQLVTHVTITGNEITNANAVSPGDNSGGIVANYADDVLIIGNVCRGCVASGISLSSNNLTRVYVEGNQLVDAVASPGTNRAGIEVNNSVTGRIENNSIDNALWGIRAFNTSTGLIVGRNTMTNCTSRIVGGANVTMTDIHDEVIQFVTGNQSTGAGSAALGANCPAVTATAPFTWVKFIAGDGSIMYVPAWK